eukprot:3426700-Amphidinium_carterae.1
MSLAESSMRNLQWVSHVWSCVLAGMLRWAGCKLFRFSKTTIPDCGKTIAVPGRTSGKLIPQLIARTVCTWLQESRGGDSAGTLCVLK